jgi:hypothetical protein
MMRAKLWVPAGELVHARGGETLAPSAVYLAGIAVPDTNALLVIWKVDGAEGPLGPGAAVQAATSRKPVKRNKKQTSRSDLNILI